jgi:hypothetical protein
MGHIGNTRLFGLELLFNGPKLLIGSCSLFPQNPALLDHLWAFFGRRFGNPPGQFLLLAAQIISADNQRVSLIPQANYGIHIRRNTSLVAIVNNLIAMIADELQIQHGTTPERQSSVIQSC